jgi:glycosyltransferase involved in cell wall biosynthesis
MTKKIIVAASNYWNSPFHVGSHNFAKLFAKNGWEVLFVSDPISLFHLFKRNNEQVKDRYKIYHGKIKSGIENVKIYVPFALITPNERPVFNSRFVTYNWQKMTIPNIVRYAQKIGFGEVDLLWFDSINQYFWLDSIHWGKSILRIADKTSQFRNINKYSLELEAKLKNGVSHIVYTAETLLPYIEEYKNKAFHISNGVDLDNFMRPAKEIPEDMSSIPKPIAIYVGAIDSWFDLNYMKNVASKCREINFVIIGSANIDISSILNESNIYFLGRKSFNEIPDYLFYADAGIIVFNKDHPVVNSVNPIKLYEYMACGLPVVATKWKELEIIDSPAYLAEDADDFAVKLKTAIIEGKSSKYINYAKNNSWDEKYKYIEKLLND